MQEDRTLSEAPGCPGWGRDLPLGLVGQAAQDWGNWRGCEEGPTVGLWALGPPPGGSPAQHHLSVLPTGGPLEVEPCPSLGPYPPWTWPAEVSEDREGQASARVLSLFGAHRADQLLSRAGTSSGPSNPLPALSNKGDRSASVLISAPGGHAQP